MIFYVSELGSFVPFHTSADSEETARQKIRAAGDSKLHVTVAA